MKFEDKLKEGRRQDIWEEYCGFLDLSLEDYMKMQNRLMQEQIGLWSGSKLGQLLLKGQKPETIDEFRRLCPLTTYEDYADILLQKQSDMLPGEPVIWVQTTWEGGKHPIKVAPYTKGMLDIFKNNVLACIMLSTSSQKGRFNVEATDKFLYGLAPLPFVTGLIPLALQDEIGLEFLPSPKEAQTMSFGERNKRGFKLGLGKGIDFFFGLGSVAYFVSLGIGELDKDKGASGGKKTSLLMHCSLPRLMKLISARKRCREEGRALKPRDLFQLKGFMVAGTDNECYKDELEELWGIRPMEMFAGTEPSVVATETWTRSGMYFFPDTCFYEFIPEDEMQRNIEDSSYQPRTCLMNEVEEGRLYELVITVMKGGAFARYRVGDLYRCVGIGNKAEETRLPRFKYVDRVWDVIDIAGFTRITEDSIQNVVNLSGLAIHNWVAKKEFTENKKPFLHMYVEMERESLASNAVSVEILKEHLGIYFKYVDNDYKDLKRILGMDPLQVTILRCGTFAACQKRCGKVPIHLNPPASELRELVGAQVQDYEWNRREKGSE